MLPALASEPLSSDSTLLEVTKSTEVLGAASVMTRPKSYLMDRVFPSLSGPHRRLLPNPPKAFKFLSDEERKELASYRKYFEADGTIIWNDMLLLTRCH